MLGQIVYRTGERGRPVPEASKLHGLSVMRVALSPDGFWAERRLKQTGRLFSRRGCRRVLVPKGFDRWDILGRYGLRRVEPTAFLRAHTAKLILAALAREGMRAERCAVALRSDQVQRELVLAAEELCPRVRDICISAPMGGDNLCQRLRWEYGIAVRPDWDQVEGAVRLHAETAAGGGVVLRLFSSELDLGGVSVTASEISGEETEYLPLLAALWESGRLTSQKLEFT